MTARQITAVKHGASPDPAGQRQRISLFANEVIFQPGSPASHFYLVDSGTVLIVDVPNKTILKAYTEGDIFGLAEVLAGGNWPFTAYAGMRTVITCFPKECLMQTLNSLPDSHQDYLQALMGNPA